MSLARLVSSALIGGLVLAAAVVSVPQSADACGAFFARKSVPLENRPSLSLERVLIVFDPAKKEEHFIREVVFRGSSEKFGFVVPTPTRPSVSEVKKPPFDLLEQSYPFARKRELEGARGGGSKGAPGGAAPQVVVLEVKYLGSFAAFVLQATDDKALAKWLAENDFASTPESDRWLAEYVKRGFYYVAFRYEPTLDKQRQDDSLRAQSVRITFPTPVAFYPYREPEHAEATDRKLRAVELWVASPSALVPVAATDDRGALAWVKPFREGLRATDQDAKAMTGTFGDELGKLLPPGPLVVQSFQDQKTRRNGYGDVVFLPEAGVGKEEDAAAFVKSTIVRAEGPK